MVKKAGETSYQETAFGIIPRSKLIPLEAEGIAKAWDFVLHERKRGTIRITPTAIKQWHKVGFGWIFPKMGGSFRTIDVTVSLHEPPSYYRAPQYMLDFCHDLAERSKHIPSIDHPDFIDALISHLTWAHHRFLWIHPFADYNGRIGRLLINVMLLNLDLPPMELNVASKDGRRRYVRALQEADGGNDADLQKIVREALEESGRAVQKLSRT